MLDVGWEEDFKRIMSGGGEEIQESATAFFHPPSLNMKTIFC